MQSDTTCFPYNFGITYTVFFILQGAKSNVNSSQEKGNIEPPTANIKPMAGPTSSVAKSQQVRSFTQFSCETPNVFLHLPLARCPLQNQQSVAVTPWRSASETPLASIRPMSLQTRTAAVLPTSQTSCSASQRHVCDIIVFYAILMLWSHWCKM